MICRAVLGKVADDAVDVDWVDLTWQQTLRRALRLVSRGGKKIDVLLPPGGRLAHGDVLTTGPQTMAVQVEAIDLLMIVSADTIRLGQLAFDLGNRHLPAQILPDAILTLDDGPTREIATNHGLEVQSFHSRFYPERVDLGPTYGNG